MMSGGSLWRQRRGQLGRMAEQRGVLGESQRREAKAAGELGGDAWRLGEAGETSSSAARRPAAALPRGRGGGQRKKKGRGLQGLSCELQNLQGL
jgi:hypothetical protein